MDDTPPGITDLLNKLAAGPSRISSITQSLTPTELLTPPVPGEWCARDVLGHLRACSDMWGKCILQILSDERPTIKAINPRTWIKRTNYLELDFHPSFLAFSVQRTELLEVLNQIAPESWSRSATVTGAGRPIERTVFSYAQWLANHERSHFRQFEKIVKAFHPAQ